MVYVTMNDLAAAVLWSFPVSFLCSGAVLWFGHKFSLVDTPTERSSHVVPTPRGAGIGIWMAFMIIGLFIVREVSFTSIAAVIGLLGFFEDRWTLSYKTRLFIQMTAAASMVYLIRGVPLSPPAILVFMCWMIFISGTANYYNFMDGINGIAGLTGLIGFALLMVFSGSVLHESETATISLTLSSACLGFLPLNFPRAKVFMGDVGSLFLGFTFASCVARLSSNINIFLCLIMFLCTFYADATVTIFHRYRRGEHLMTAHRSHLYQYMSNELGLPHWGVALMYAFVQLVFGLLAVLAYHEGFKWQLAVFFTFSVLFLISYRRIKNIRPGSLNRNFII
ncbi:MAG: glycosyltransferase family 4 protein [Nitrospirae bacterium]|nr:glycosyltransferase family 4 protein [Nitrospirota bacterium]